MSRLSDLAFAIETRLALLTEMIRTVDRNLNVLAERLAKEADLSTYVEREGMRSTSTRTRPFGRCS